MMSTSSSFVPLGLSGQTQNPNTVIASSVIDSQLSRTDYYDGRLLKAVDLTRDQQYLDVRLREVGRALGHGVVRGLTLSLSQQRITVAPGVAITPAGRTLHLDHSMVVDLGNRALIQTLNRSPSGHLADGLYAVVITYAEYTSGIAEVFPTDLSSRSQPRPNLVVEGVTIDLVKLDVALPSIGAQSGAQSQALVAAQGIRARAQLAPQLTQLEPPQIGSDSVALGVLALRRDQLQWLDPYLLRHPPRNNQHHPHSEDLAEHYQHLFGEIRAARVAVGLPELNWAARDYLGLLPPVGPVPKDTINPVAGWQAFFPSTWRVQVAPVRDDDWQTLVEEALVLEPMDLTSTTGYDVLVVARLDPKNFARYAPQLEDSTSTSRYPVIDPLLLRFSPRVGLAESVLDTDASTWSAIWNTVPPGGVWFIRRAPRAATNPVVGMLANGWMQVEVALQKRTTAESLNDAAALLVVAANDPSQRVQGALLDLCLAVDRRFDAVSWRTAMILYGKSQADKPTDFGDSLSKFAQALAAIPANAGITALQTALTKVLADAGIADAQLKQKWLDLAKIAT